MCAPIRIQQGYPFDGSIAGFEENRGPTYAIDLAGKAVKAGAPKVRTSQLGSRFAGMADFFIVSDSFQLGESFKTGRTALGRWHVMIL